MNQVVSRLITSLAWLLATTVAGCTGCSSCSKGYAPQPESESFVDVRQMVGATSIKDGEPEAVDPTRAGVDPAMLKSYRADLCWFGAASLSGVGDRLASRARGHQQRAAHACQLAASQREPAVPGLDEALAALAPIVASSVASAGKSGPQGALDAPLARVGRELSPAQRAVTAPHRPVRNESERLARTAYDLARPVAWRWVMQGIENRGAEPRVAGADVESLRQAVVALARYGTSHPADEWVRTVEPALESFLEAAASVARRSSPDGGGARANTDLGVAFLSLIEAQERAFATEPDARR